MCYCEYVLIGERAKRARHYQGCIHSSWCGIYMEVRVINSSTCHVYVMWAELGHCHFLYVPVVSNVVTTGNSTGTKCFKMEPCAWVESHLSSALLL